MRGKGLYLHYLEEKAEAEMDANLRVTGRREPHLSGQIDLLRGVIARSFKTPAKVAAAEEPPPYSLDLMVNIPKNCWVRNEAANIELRGQMRVLQQRGQLSLLGNLETVRGSYYFYGNNFRIQRGSVTFDELAVINPQLDVKAWTEVDRERIELTIGGRMRSPSITLASSSGYSEGDIIRLLTLHQSPAGLDTLGTGAVVASQAGDYFGSYIQKAFNRKASSILGVDKFTVKPGPSGLHLRGAEITLGTYLSSKIYVEYSRRLSQESGEQVGVEYNLSRNLSLQGNRDAMGLYRVGFNLKWEY
jgi:translocation and assembly module TamB